MNLLIEMSLVIGFGSILGVLSSFLASFIDTALDYGHMWGEYRFEAARKVAESVNMAEYFDKRTKDLEGVLFGDRIGAFDELYWQVATSNSELLNWICVVCISGKVAIGLSVVLLIPIVIIEPIISIYSPLIILVSFSVSTWITKKI